MAITAINCRCDQFRIRALPRPETRRIIAAIVSELKLLALANPCVYAPGIA
jgi:hypothetical protein